MVVAAVGLFAQAAQAGPFMFTFEGSEGISGLGMGAGGNSESVFESDGVTATIRAFDVGVPPEIFVHYDGLSLGATSSPTENNAIDGFDDDEYLVFEMSEAVWLTSIDFTGIGDTSNVVDVRLILHPLVGPDVPIDHDFTTGGSTLDVFAAVGAVHVTSFEIAHSPIGTDAAGNQFRVDGLSGQTVAMVPEPASLALMSTGLLGVALLGRRRRMRARDVA